MQQDDRSIHARKMLACGRTLGDTSQTRGSAPTPRLHQQYRNRITLLNSRTVAVRLRYLLKLEHNLSKVSRQEESSTHAFAKACQYVRRFLGDLLAGERQQKLS